MKKLDKEITNMIEFQSINTMEIDNTSIKIFEGEALWDQIEIINIDLNLESGASDSDFSLEFFIKNKNTKLIKKRGRSKSL
jgi:hypothetical protein